MYSDLATIDRDTLFTFAMLSKIVSRNNDTHSEIKRDKPVSIHLPIEWDFQRSNLNKCKSKLMLYKMINTHK